MNGVPEVTVAAALDDGDWFDRHPSRRFRARRGAGGYWLIGKCGDVLLRTFTRCRPIDDSDAAIATAWYAAVWPELLLAKANRKSRQAGVRRAGGRR